MVNAPTSDRQFILPDNPEAVGCYVTDTSQMFAALEGETSERRRFGTMSALLKIKTEYLHNAGNDAHVCYLVQSTQAADQSLTVC